MHVNVGIRGADTEVIPRRQAAALTLGIGLRLFGFRRLAAVRQVDAKGALLTAKLARYRQSLRL